jgi:hypothetical protein
VQRESLLRVVTQGSKCGGWTLCLLQWYLLLSRSRVSLVGGERGRTFENCDNQARALDSSTVTQGQLVCRLLLTTGMRSAKSLALASSTPNRTTGALLKASRNRYTHRISEFPYIFPNVRHLLPFRPGASVLRHPHRVLHTHAMFIDDMHIRWRAVNQLLESVSPRSRTSRLVYHSMTRDANGISEAGTARQ